MCVKRKNTKLSEFNVLKKMITHFQEDLIKQIKKKLKINLKKIPYKVNTQGTKNYLINIFKSSIRQYLTQKLPNSKIKNMCLYEMKLNKTMEKFLETNVLIMFYRFY